MNTESTCWENRKARARWAWRSFLWSMVLIAGIDGVSAVFRHYELSWWLRLPLIMLPLLPLTMLARLYWQMLAEDDELARHIARDAFVFAFFAMLGVFICTDLLRAGGVLLDFAWRTRTLFYVMVATLTVGQSWSAWRYR